LPYEEAEIYAELHTKPVDDAATKFETNFDIYGTDNNEEIYNSFVYQPTGRSTSVSDRKIQLAIVSTKL
jgi:hypothetical protein